MYSVAEKEEEDYTLRRSHVFTSKSSKQVAFMAGLILVIAFAASPSFGDDMTMSPHKIILNAQGQFDNVQAVIRMPLKAGYSLSNYQVFLSFDGIMIIEAYEFRYCYIDDNFLASFDRVSIQANRDVIDMAGRIVNAEVSGWFEAIDNDGNSYRQEFSYTDNVEILDPGMK